MFDKITQNFQGIIEMITKNSFKIYIFLYYIMYYKHIIKKYELILYKIVINKSTMKISFSITQISNFKMVENEIKVRILSMKVVDFS